MDKHAIANALKRSWKLWGGALGLVFIIVWTSGMLRTRTAPGTIAFEPGTPLPEAAEIITAQAVQVPERLTASGSVQSTREIRLRAKMGAYIKDVLVSAGQAVNKGDLLIELDPREIQQQLVAAEAQLEQAQMAHQRAKRLLTTNATTQQEFESVESAYKSAAADVDRIKVILSYSRVTAPIDGIVVDRLVEIGDLASPGTLLLSLYDPTDMRLEADVPIRLVRYFQVGREVTIALNQNAIISGTVSEVVSSVDTATRTQRVKIRLNRQDNPPLPGTYGEVRVEGDSHATMMLPTRAVYQVGQLKFVQIVRDGRAIQRLVKTGLRTQDQIEILSGIEAGEQLLLNPVAR